MSATGNRLEVIDEDGDMILEVGIDEPSDKMSDCEEHKPQELGIQEEHPWRDSDPSHRSCLDSGDLGSDNSWKAASLLDSEKEELQELASEEVPEKEAQPGYRRYACLLVSSMFLTHASPVFKVMLDGRFAEGQHLPSKQNPPITSLPEDDPNTDILFCKILHFRENVNGKPKSADQLISIAKFSDKYDCAQSLCPWFRAHLYRSTIPESGLFDQEALGKRHMNLEQVMMIAYLVNDNDLFSSATETYYREKAPDRARDCLERVMGDWLPDNMAETIQEWQKYFIDRASLLGLDVLDSMIAETHTVDHRGCFYTFGADNDDDNRVALCTGLAKRLGALSAVLISRHMWPTRHKKEDSNKSVNDWMKQWREVAAIKFHDDRVLPPACYDAWDECPCVCESMLNVNTELELRIDRLDCDLKGGICLPCFKQKGKVETPAECPNIITHKLWPHCVLNARMGRN